MMFAPKKARSTTSSGTVTAKIAIVGHPHRSRSTTARIDVVIAIVAVTATPYAAARFVEAWKAMTRPTAQIISSQFTDGM